MSAVFIRTVPAVMQHFGCNAVDAQRFIDLREEGYSSHMAALMAGLADPPDYDDERDDTCPECDGHGGDRMNDYCLPCPLCGEG